MLVHEHIRVVAMWFGAWAKSKVRHEAECTTTEAGDQTAREQANKFAQLKRLAHHRYELWKRQHQAEEQNVVSKITVHESVECSVTTEGEGIGNGGVTEDQVTVIEPEASYAGEHEEAVSALGGELGSLQDTEEQQCEPSHVPEAESNKLELQEEENQCEPPRTHGATPQRDQLHVEEKQCEPPWTHDAAPKEIQLPVEENLQSYSQVQPQIDRPQTTKELLSVVPSCEIREEEIKPRIKSIISSVTFTDSPSFSAWTPCDEKDEHRMRLRNITFEGCEQTSLQIKSSCDFANVKFIGCKFNRTVFMDVKLCSVTFVRVDFTDTTLYWVWLRNVRFFEIEFNHDLWRATFLKNALVDMHGFKLSPNSEREYGVRAPLASSKTERCKLDSALSPDDLKQELCCSEGWKRDIYLREPVSKVDILTRLGEHKAIIDRIMQYCFPGPSVHIYEYPDGIRIPGREDLAEGHNPKQEARPPHRGQHFLYFAVDANSSAHRTSRHLTTYFGSMVQETPKASEVPTNLPRKGTGGSTALLRVNRAISEQSLKYLYGRTFHLQCSPVGAKEFLIRHRSQMMLAKELVLYFHWQEDGVTIQSIRTNHFTDPWRELFNTLRHEFSFVPAIRLHVGRRFWNRHYNWTQGADPMLKTTDGPFWSLPKIAAPEPRWQYRWKAPRHRTDGTSLRIFIEDTEGEERTEFVQNLAEGIEKRRVGRPLFVRGMKHQCLKDLTPDDLARHESTLA